MHNCISNKKVSVSHLVRAEGGVHAAPGDRVFQGASLVFDLPVEEIWFASYAGATLVAVTPEMAPAVPTAHIELTRQIVAEE